MTVPVSLFHCPGQDIKVGEYDIPKDSIVLVELRAPCQDGKFWKDPEVFRPERFLDITDPNEGSFIPYGTGKIFT
jgi:cytochrome P450